MKTISLVLYIVFLFTGCGDRNSDQIFSKIRYIDHQKTYFFSVNSNSKKFNVEVYPKNMVCDFDTVRLANGDFSIKQYETNQQCIAEFMQESSVVGSCVVINNLEATQIRLAIYNPNPAFGNAGEPFAGDVLPIACGAKGELKELKRTKGDGGS